MSASAHVTAVERAVDAFNRRDLDAYFALYDPSAAFHGMPGDAADVPAGRAFYESAYAGLPDVRLDVREVVADDERVAVRYRVSGTQTGEFLGVPPSGRRVEIDGLTLLRFDGDRVVERWQAMDTLELLQQLGAVPVPVS